MFAIYPNPTTEVLNIASKSADNITKVIIYDTTGKMLHEQVFEDSNSQQQIDVSSLAKGIYMIEVSTLRAAQIVKFVKK